MTAGTWNPTIEQGADWTVELTWADDGTPIDLTGYTARMSLRHSARDTVSIHLDTTNGRISLGGAAGTITLSLTAAETAEIPAHNHPYDLEVVNPDGRVVRLVQGIATVSREQTRTGDA